jgi:PilZ domain
VEHRKTRRFNLELPIAITRNGAEKVCQRALTRNISSGGVLFTSEREPDIGGSLEYVITLSAQSDPPVNLRCIGKVVRSEPVAAGSGGSHASFAVAVTLERYEFLRAAN